MAKIKLQAPDGTTEASVGTTLYPADLDGTLEVAPDDAPELEAAGFQVVPDVTDATPMDMTDHTTLYCQPGAACAWQGQTFVDANGDGQIVVLSVAVRDLLVHGFSLEPVSA